MHKMYYRQKNILQFYWCILLCFGHQRYSTTFRVVSLRNENTVTNKMCLNHSKALKSHTGVISG